MNRFIYFDNLRSAAVVLTLAALLLQPWHAFYEESAVIAISIVFFIILFSFSFLIFLFSLNH